MQSQSTQEADSLTDALSVLSDTNLLQQTPLRLSHLMGLAAEPEQALLKDTDQFFRSSSDPPSSGSKLLRLMNKPTEEPAHTLSSHGETVAELPAH